MRATRTHSVAFFFFQTDELRGINTSNESTAKRCKKELPRTGRPHANVLKTGQSQQCERRATKHVGKRGLPEGRQRLAWTSEFNAPRTVVLRTMNFVMTPPAVSAPMSKRMRSRSSRPSNCVSASPGERATPNQPGKCVPEEPSDQRRTPQRAQGSRTGSCTRDRANAAARNQRHPKPQEELRGPARRHDPRKRAQNQSRPTSVNTSGQEADKAAMGAD